MEATVSSEPASKPPRADERRETTDIVYREIVSAEKAARHAKTERLRLARLRGSRSGE